jgi:Tfp pilus assembly protein PilZ
MATKGRTTMERRKHFRKTCFFEEVDYSAHNEVYTDPIKNISNGGVFIETDKMLSVGADVTMLFADLANIDLIRVAGDIIRITPNGVAVKFDIDDSMKMKNIEKYIDMV